MDSSNPGKSKEGLDSDPTVDDECKGNATDGDSGSTTGGGGTYHVNGWWEMWGQVNNVLARGLYFETAELHKLSDTIYLYLSSPVLFKEQEISLKWEADGNTKDPDGHFYILGSAVKEPPVPVGKLTFSQTMYHEGEKPPFHWEVTRE